MARNSQNGIESKQGFAARAEMHCGLMCNREQRHLTGTDSGWLDVARRHVKMRLHLFLFRLSSKNGTTPAGVSE